MQRKQADEPARLLTASRTLEPANKAYFLYVRQKPTEQAKLLKMVLSNCQIDAVNITPTYRKPFDLIVARAKNERPETWVIHCTGHMGDTSSLLGGSDALDGVFGHGRKAWDLVAMQCPMSSLPRERGSIRGRL